MTSITLKLGIRMNNEAKIHIFCTCSNGMKTIRRKDHEFCTKNM